MSDCFLFEGELLLLNSFTSPFSPPAGGRERACEGEEKGEEGEEGVEREEEEGGPIINTPGGVFVVIAGEGA